MELPPPIPRNSYLARKIPDHPLADSQGYVLEHRRVAWAHYGPFPRSMEVHHRDEDKLNNSPENLQVMTKRHHAELHAADRKAIYDWDAIIADYESGMSLPQISRKHGVNGGNASKQLRAKGVEMRPNRVPKGNPISLEARLRNEHSHAQEMVDGYLAGKSLQEAGAPYGSDASVVASALARRGIKRRRAGRPQVKVFTTEQVQEAIAKARSWRQLGALLGVSKDWAQRVVSDHGLAFASMHEPRRPSRR